MFDIRAIRDNPAAFDAGLKRRGLEPLSSGLIAKDEELRAIKTRLQEAQARRNAVRVTLICTSLCGVVLAGASALFGDVAVGLAGGERYTHLGPYAVGFAAVGGLYSIVYVLMNAEIAATAKRPALWLWLGAAAIGLAAVALRPSTVGSVLALSVVTAAVTTAAMALTYRLRRRPA